MALPLFGVFLSTHVACLGAVLHDAGLEPSSISPWPDVENDTAACSDQLTACK